MANARQLFVQCPITVRQQLHCSHKRSMQVVLLACVVSFQIPIVGILDHENFFTRKFKAGKFYKMKFPDEFSQFNYSTPLRLWQSTHQFWWVSWLKLRLWSQLRAFSLQTFANNQLNIFDKIEHSQLKLFINDSGNVVQRALYLMTIEPQ